MTQNQLIFSQLYSPPLHSPSIKTGPQSISYQHKIDARHHIESSQIQQYKNIKIGKTKFLVSQNITNVLLNTLEIIRKGSKSNSLCEKRQRWQHYQTFMNRRKAMDLQPCLDHIQWAHKGGSNSTYNAKTQITHYYTTQPNVIKMLKLEPNLKP